MVLTLIPASVLSQNAVIPSDVVAAPDQKAITAQWKRAARKSFAKGDLPAAREHMTKLLELYRAQRSGNPNQWCQRLVEVTHEYLRMGDLKLAMALLGEAADLSLPFPDAHEGELGGVAAGLNRRLVSLDAEERFELLLEWSMPNEQRSAVRLLTTITPTEAPPAAFARAIGERPRDSSFAVPKIGEVRGLFCSAWELVTAAEQTGGLRRLTTELSRLVDDDVPNASFALTLAKIVGARRADDQLLAELAAPATHADADVVIAAACLTQDWLQPIGESILNTKLEQTFGRESPLMRSLLRRALATAVRQRYADSSPNVVTNSDLKWWIPARGSHTSRNGHAATRPIWLSHDDHIQHLAGSGNDWLLFRYPLTGEFEFSCEAQNGGLGGTDGGVAYGGRDYEISTSDQVLRVWDADGTILAQLHSPFASNQPLATYNRLAINVTASGVTLSSNKHVVWRDDLKTAASPWIAIRAFGDRAPFFRNLKISGNPVIPREVKMSDYDQLRGWVANYDRAESPPATQRTGLMGLLSRLTNVPAWTARGGVVYGARALVPGDTVEQNRLHYERPLHDGESISYEFHFDPGQFEVHPTLGRTAFLIEPDGVRLHWMTDGDREWTGLTDDNAIVEPLNRRGPKPLPLVPGEWNRVTLALDKDTLSLSLNETSIYVHKIEPTDDHTFGFYHDRNRSEARVRQVVMRGDWPERLTDEQLNDLAAVSNPDRSAADRRVLGAIFADQHLHGSALTVHRRAAALSAAERYDFLAGWVLPSRDHETLRLALDFTPTNPAPPVSDVDLSSLSGRSRVTTGGELISPALDLVAVAGEIGKLRELRDRVSGLLLVGEQQHRARLSMLALIDIGLGDFVQAKESLDQLAALVAAGSPHSFSQRWPETLAIWHAAPYAETRDAVRDMVFHIAEKQIQKNIPSGYAAWDQCMRALASQVRYFDLCDRDETLRDASAQRSNGESPLANWVPASRETARTRGQGFPQARWELSEPATIANFASHDDDFLFYRIPLRGNFEVECDVSGFGWRETNMWIAGQWVGPVYTLREYDVGDFRDSQRLAIEPPISSPDAWIRYRAVVQNGACTTYFNGRKVHERALDAKHDPWIAIRSPYSTDGAVRNLRITGQPEIPAEVNLTNAADLPGWLPINNGHRVGPNQKWRPLGDLPNGGGIFGTRWDDLPGSSRETLLRYHRPMAEDGTIEYDFYYQEGETDVHPALDRLVFMLLPDGVRVHWVTDCEFDRTELAPDNLVDEPQNRRGPNALPLKPNDWNRLQLSLTGDLVAITLNDELIFQRELEPTNQRTFGLFHYADQTTALIRNVVWRGDWPRELPSVTKQELAGEGVDFLDESISELTAVFEHDFANAGFPQDLFGMIIGKRDDFAVRADGLHVSRVGAAGYHDSTFAPRLTIQGDFDIVASFEQLETTPAEGGSGGLYLMALLDNEKSNEYLLCRRLLRHRTRPQPIVQASYVAREIGGARRTQLATHTAEATSGKLRIARRGGSVYYMFAEGDSPIFRSVGKQTETTDDISSLRLLVQAQGEGLTKVVWKTLSIRAHKLSGLALLDQSEVLAELNKQSDALPQQFHHDFAKDPFSDDRFHRWRSFAPAGTNGLRMLSAGTDNWTSTGFAPHLALAGDFDIAIRFDDLNLGMPKGAQNSALYLQVEFPDASKTQANVLIVQQSDGERLAYAQVKLVDIGGNSEYRRLRVDPIDQVEGVRIARRGTRLVFLYRVKGAGQDQILAETKASDLPIPSTFIRGMLHTGGADLQSEVMLKQFSVRAEKIDPNPADAVESPSPLKSIRKLFE